MNRDKIIGQKRNVLTHGFIELTNYMNGDYEVYRNAKVSTGAPKDDIEDQKRLINFLVEKGHCYTGDMQVLTDSGWKRWDRCNQFETYLVPDPTTRKLIKQKLELKKFKYNGIIHKMQNNRMSFSVSDNHTMWFKDKFKNNIDGFKKIKIKEMPHWGHFDPLNGYCLVDKDGEKDKKFMFIGFFIGDGCLISKNVISFHFTKERKIKYLEKLCIDLNLKYVIKKCSCHNSGFKFAIRRENWMSDLINLELKSNNKKFDTDKLYLGNTGNNVRGILDGLINSDGSIKKDRKQISYSSNSEHIICLYELLTALIGIDSHRRSVGNQKCIQTVAYTGERTTLESRGQYYSTKEFNDDVYCTTTKTGLLMVRGAEDKFAFVCGNSSPLEFIEIEWHVKCPIYVARQWVRHRMSEMNEYSGRYRKILSDFEPVNDLMDLTEAEKMKYVELMSESYDFYEKVVNRVSEKFPGKENTHIRGRVREKMRGVLGTGYYTEYFWKCNLHSLANFLKKRFDGGQPEIVVYAENMLEMARPIAPICFDAIERHWLKKGDK